MHWKQIAAGILLVLSVGMLGGCNKPGYEQTPQTEAAIDLYISAVKAQIERSEGQITYTATVDDPVLEKKKSEVMAQYSYTVKDNKESFTLCTVQDDNTVVNLLSDGDAVYTISEDGTKVPYEQNMNSYLRQKGNPLSTLLMFRMDANFKLQKDTITAIQSTTTGEQTVIDVTFDPAKVTSMVIKNGDGVERAITKMQRRYVVQNGRISHIEIYAVQRVVSGEDRGDIETRTVVDIS